MNKAEFFTVLRSGLSAHFGVPFKAKTIKEGEQILLEITAGRYKKYFDWEIDDNKEVRDADMRSKVIVDEVFSSVMEIAFSEIKEDIRKIFSACSFYKNNCRERVLPPNDFAGKSSKNDLIKMSCQIFIDRILEHFKTLAALSNVSTPSDFLTYELSVCVILRSCILDCLLISAWVRDDSEDNKFIRDLVVSSFLRVPDGAKPEIKAEFKNAANYYNIGIEYEITKEDKCAILEHTSNTGILQYLKNGPNIKRNFMLYDLYSKFDHFSAVPYFMRKTPYDKMANMLDAFHLIKFSLSQMLIKKEDDLLDPFCDILDIAE